MAAKRIGILTGGGDVPGLNSVIKTVVYRASDAGSEVIGIRRGWEGLTHVDLNDPASRTHYILPLDRENTRTVDRTGGTFLHTSRTNPQKMKKLPAICAGGDFPKVDSTKKGVTSQVYDITSQVLKNVERLGLNYLVAIGGDDTLSYAARLDKEGVKVIAVPKTMDNEVRNTEYCIGFSTAITRAMDAIDRQRTTVGSHERIGVFRVFGRDAGYTALYTAYVTGIRCAIPEFKFDLKNMIDLLLQEREPQQLFHRRPIGRRGVGRLRGSRVRRGRCLRPSQEGQRRRRPERRDQEGERPGDGGKRPHLRTAQRQPGLRR
jgi:6-phosphofructokinase 1